MPEDLEITVWCTFTFESWHFWPAPPTKYVYLGNSHRHMFHVKAVFEETESRAIEFIDARQRLEGFAQMHLVGTAVAPVPYSCEDMAKRIFLAHEGLVSVEVSEDGENGATVALQ